MFLQGISKFQKSKFIIELMKSFPNGSLSLILTFLREKTYFKSRHNESSTHKSLDKIRSFLRIENLIVKFKGFLLLSLLFQVFTRFHHIFLKYKSNRRIFVYLCVTLRAACWEQQEFLESSYRDAERKTQLRINLFMILLSTNWAKIEHSRLLSKTFWLSQFSSHQSFL